LELLATLDYPGNVRQLRNLLEAANVFADGATIARGDIEQVLESGSAMAASGAGLGPQDPFTAGSFEEFKDKSEALFFRRKLDENGGNVKRTAERLAMQRSHLYKKLDRYGLR
jgi:two-component system nitrogen regulation response regulator NtrX